MLLLNRGSNWWNLTCLTLTLLFCLLVFVAAIVFEQQSPLTAAQQWGDGFWGLLSFSMQMLQMLLVLVTGVIISFVLSFI